MNIVRIPRIVRLADTDAAGVLYFARLFEMMHGVYEELLSRNNIRIRDILKDDLYLFPIVSTQADYKKPIYLDDELVFQVSVQRRSTSFQVDYQIFQDEELVAEGYTVHVCLRKLDRKPTAIPPAFNSLF